MAYQTKITKRKERKNSFATKNKWEKIAEIEEDGIFLEDYPTDSFDGSNTGDAELYYYNGKIYEINRERGGDKVLFGEVTGEQKKQLLEYWRHTIYGASTEQIQKKERMMGA